MREEKEYLIFYLLLKNIIKRSNNRRQPKNNQAEKCEFSNTKKSVMMFTLSCNIFEHILSNLIPSRLPNNIPFLFQLVTAHDIVVCWGTSIIMILKYFFLSLCATAAAAIIVAFTMIVPWMESKVRRKENYIEQGLSLMWIVRFFPSSFGFKIKKTRTKAKLWVKFSSFFSLFVVIVIRLLYFILLSENIEKKWAKIKRKRARWKEVIKVDKMRAV